MVVLLEFCVLIRYSFPVLLVLELESSGSEDLHDHILRPLLKEDIGKTQQPSQFLKLPRDYLLPSETSKVLLVFLVKDQEHFCKTG